MPEIETARLRYRIPSPHDLDALMLIVGDPQVVKYLGIEPGAIPSREETKTTIERMIEFWAQHGFGRWVVIEKENGKLVGLCGFRLLEGTPELFYMFARENWGRGFATEAARAAVRYGFEELGFERIVAVTRHANIESMNVMIKIGMKYEKETRDFGVDAVRYAARRDEYQLDDSSYTLSQA
jgi:RimJ/RimL family protein N-acetyltransferase